MSNVFCRLVKISILFFYYRFLSGSKMRWILYGIGSFVLLFTVAIWLVRRRDLDLPLTLPSTAH